KSECDTIPQRLQLAFAFTSQRITLGELLRDGGSELRDREGLRQIIVRAHHHALAQAGEGGASRHENDRNKADRGIAPDGLEQFVTVLLRHIDVVDHQVHRLVTEDVQRLVTAGRTEDFVTLAREREAEHLAQACIVIDKQDTPLCWGWVCRSSGHLDCLAASYAPKQRRSVYCFMWDWMSSRSTTCTCSSSSLSSTSSKKPNTINS